MAEVFTQDERLEIAGRARTLFQRLDGPPNEPRGTPPCSPDEVFDQLRERYGDPDALERRLEMLGVTEEDVKAAVAATHWPTNEPLPDWMERLESIVSFVSKTSPDRESRWTPEEEVPFCDIFTVLVDYGLKSLDPDLACEAVLPMASRLMEQLKLLCLRPLYVEFKSFVEYHDEALAHADPETVPDPSTELYQSFVKEMLGSGFRNLCLEYPVLARKIVSAIENWEDAVTEVIQRTERDKQTLRNRFSISGEVKEFRPLTDDAHARGRVPVNVSFSDGSVVYKPRSVECGKLFYTTLERLNPHLSLEFTTPDYVSADQYGWMEHVEFQEVADEDAASRYYHRAGMLLCLAYVLNVTDCQLENVIATGEHPVIVDCETLCHPYADPGEIDGMFSDPAKKFIDDSPLLTYLLPYGNGYPDESATTFSPITLAGFSGQSGSIESTEKSIPSFVAVNTDVMSIVEQHPEPPEGNHTPKLNGEPVPPEEFTQELVAGFTEAYRTIRTLTSEDKFLGEVVPVDAKEGTENRFLFRQTETYGSILGSASGRDPLRDGILTSVVHERLVAPLVREDNFDFQRWSPLFAAERRALRREDFPRLVSRIDETRLYHDGDALDLTVHESGWTRVEKRLSRFGSDRLDDCQNVITRSFTPPAKVELPKSEPWDEVELLNAATAMFEEILDAATVTADGREWVSSSSTSPLRLIAAKAPLNYGKCGIVLAGAALYDATGKERYRAIVEELVSCILERTGSNRTEELLGAMRGTGSVVYTLSVASELVQNEPRHAATREIAELVTDERIKDTTNFDVAEGVAGALLGLLAYYDRSGEAAIRRQAVKCGRRLLQARTSKDGHLVWCTENGEVRTGFAHGQAGIGYALARLSTVAGNGRYERAAREAFEFERNHRTLQGDSGQHSYREFSRPQWCGGPAGLALAQAGVADHLDESQWRTAARGTLDAVQRLDPHPYDNVCCGNLGRGLVELEVTRRLGGQTDRPGLIDRCLERRDQYGLRLPGDIRSLRNVSFFDGLSGAVYAVLRRRSPESLPSVLLFE